jgi:hypothetical protein
MIVDGGFGAEVIIIDGFDFSIAERGRISALKDFAAETGICVWYSCDLAGSPAYDKHGIPSVVKEFEDLIDVVIALEPKGTCTELRVVKEHGNYSKADAVRLDPKTLLILEN